MAKEEVIRKDLREIIDQIGSSDILIGIPSYNNAGTIGRVVEAVSGGVAKYFPESNAVLVNSDGGSLDGTTDIVTQASVDLKNILVSHRVNPLHKISTPYHGIPGKGSALRMIFEIARAIGVTACAVVDSDLRSITPEWIELLLRPIIRGGYDYVAPYYLRHKYDGTITNSIVYPLTRALYGKRIRQPIGGEFGFSGALAGYFSTQEVWETDVARYGIDIWMTTMAITKESRICQSYLGAKIHDPKDPGSDLSVMLAQVMGSIFGQMEEHVEFWKTVKGSESVPVLGFQFDVGLEPISVAVDSMLKAFELGLRDLGSIWGSILSPGVLEDLQSIRPTAAEIKFQDELWVRIIYEFAVASHRDIMTRDHLLKSFTPLYLGRVGAFFLETQRSSHREVEDKIERLCMVFEGEKHYLIEQWDKPVITGGSP